MQSMNSFTMSPIGTITSCYKEKFGIPRQPNLVKEATAELHLTTEFTQDSIRGLKDFSHVWISFIFHETLQQGWKPLVRPPRLGGNTKVGVFATRSMFRPNGMGLSVLELLDIEMKSSKVILHLGACDLLDGTPVFDIKPYLPYVDSIPDAKASFANDKPKIKMDVSFSDEAQIQCKQAELRLGKSVRLVIEEVLQLDPRPAFQQGNISDRVYAMKLYDFDVSWQYCENNRLNVLGVTLLNNEY